MRARLICRLPVLAAALGFTACAPATENLWTKKPAPRNSAFEVAWLTRPTLAFPWDARSSTLTPRAVDPRPANPACANLDNMPVIRPDTKHLAPMPTGDRARARSALPMPNGCTVFP